MSMCGICWFDGRALTDEIDDLRQRVKEAEAEARAERDRFISALITMRKALVLNGTDSQGGRGYKSGDNVVWVSWPGILPSTRTGTKE